MQKVTIICYFRFTIYSTKSTAFPRLIICSESPITRQKFLPGKENIQKNRSFSSSSDMLV